MREIQKADHVARKKALFIVVVGGSISAIILFLCSINKTAIHNWLENNLEFLLNNSIYVFLVLFILFSPLAICSAYLYKFSNLVIKSKRMPPENHPIVRDTRVYEGSQAVMRAKILQVLALFLMLFSIILPAFIVYILVALTSSM